MLSNLMQTDTAEGMELVSGTLVVWMLGFGVLPILLISRIRLIQRSWSRELVGELLAMLLTLACQSGIALTQYQSHASLVRNHRELRLMLVPSNVMAAVHGYGKRQLAVPAEFGSRAAD